MKKRIIPFLFFAGRVFFIISGTSEIWKTASIQNKTLVEAREIIQVEKNVLNDNANHEPKPYNTKPSKRKETLVDSSAMEETHVSFNPDIGDFQ